MLSFSKSTVYLGNSMKDFNNVRDILDHHHIKYKYKLKDRSTSSFFPGRGVVRTQYGSSGNLEQGTTYEILVSKEDYESACEYLRVELNNN